MPCAWYSRPATSASPDLGQGSAYPARMASSSPRAQTRSRSASAKSSTRSRSSAKRSPQALIRKRSVTATLLCRRRTRSVGLASRRSGWRLRICSVESARRIGSGARDIDPEHRRDGLGLLLIALAIVVAAVEWWSLEGSAAQRHARCSGRDRGHVGLDGAGLACWSWRGGYCVTQPGHAPHGRLVIGWIALLGGTLGIVHALAGTPQPPEGAEVMRDAGGLMGFMFSAPLVAAVSEWVAVPLLFWSRSLGCSC